MTVATKNHLVQKLNGQKARSQLLSAAVFSALLICLSVAFILRQLGIAAVHTERILDCPATGVVAHAHDASCYDAEGNLVCPLPERELHVHDDGCYEETRELVCGLEEGEGHVHDDSCYEVTRELVCGLDEVTQEHVHGPGCFREVEVEDGETEVADEQEASIDDVAMPAQEFSHAFNDEDDNLVLRVDVEAPEGALPEGSTMRAAWVDPAELTTDERVALEAALAEKTEGRLLESQAVGITFVDVVGEKVEPVLPVCVTLTSALANGAEEPIVLYLMNAQEVAAQAGLEDEQVVEDEVQAQAQTLDVLDEQGLLDRDMALADDQIAFDTQELSTLVLATVSGDVRMRAEDDTVTVTVNAPAAAGIPQGATLAVSEIAQDTVEYEAYAGQALEAVGAENAELARFFDITIVDALGNELQPKAPVEVKIKLADAPTDAPQPSVVHFAEAEGEIAPEVIPADANKRTTTFEAEGFSVYGVVYTVDYHYQIDGQDYELTVPGGGCVALSEVLRALGVTTNDASSEDPVAAALANVESVEFGDPSLVSVSKVEEDTTVGALKEQLGLEGVYSAELTDEEIAELDAAVIAAGDWALVSLQPFESEESLTVTMRDGATYVVRVTDAQKPYKDVESLENGTYIIYNSFDSGKQYAIMKNDGTSTMTNSTTGVAINASDVSNYTWKVTKNSNGTFTIKSTKSNLYINLWGNNNTKDEWASSTKVNLTLENASGGITITYGSKAIQRRTTGSTAGFYANKNISGYGKASLVFYKIEESSSGGSTSTPGIVLNDDERDELEEWKETLQKFNTLTDYDKTAKVFDEDQRIYQVDLTASSGVMDFYKDVDLGFVLDVSNSMKFPSSLKALEDSSGNEQQVWMTADWLNWAQWAYAGYYNQQGCFYILSDPALTSTIYKIYKDGNQWKYQDASEKAGSKVYDINDGTVFKEPYRQAYTLYYADDTKTRFTYLQESVAYAMQTLHKIVKPTEHVDDETASVRIAYNFFCENITKSDSFKDLRDPANSGYTIPLELQYANSGTRQDRALYDGNGSINNLSANEFGWHSGSDQYVILVTDGAPNGATMNEVRAAATNLRTQNPNVKIIAIGLSTKDVDGGSQMLYDIADDVDGDGRREFYEAEKAQDLELILLNILRSIMARGVVRGTITDTIDSAFYPVDASGNPLAAGVYDASGSLIPNASISDYVSGGKPTAAHENDVFYTWEQVGDQWKVTWYNQKAGWEDGLDETGDPWNGTVYVKAKEDYLGGNLIETNDSATFEPTGLKLIIDHQEEDVWRKLENMPKLPYPVPRVNVHNLETDETSTTWTVYKGTTVTPKEQLEALWNNIPIEEVVSASENGQHKRTTGSAANVGAGGTGETFTLASLIAQLDSGFNIDSLIDQLSATKTSASKSFDYNGYGHDSGTITVTVRRTEGTQTPATHTADTVGTPAEQYQVIFSYKPYSEAERMDGRVKDPSDADHHNGTGTRGTEETGTLTSTNTHTINVFKKGVKITKVDKTNLNKKLTGAVFALYRADASGTADVSAYDLPAGNYTLVSDSLLVNANGVIEIDPHVPDKANVSDKTLYEPNTAVGAAEGNHDTVYYLVEKTAPNDYSKMPGAIKFTLSLTETKGNDSDAELYDWVQRATVSAAEHANGTTEYLVDDGEADGVYAYRIKNGKPTDITLIKVDQETGVSIGGAKFALLKGHENLDLTKLTITAITGGAQVTPQDYVYNGTTIKVIEVPEGGVRIAGLADDTYTLREVAPPDGYLISGGDKEFKTDNGAIKNADDSAHTNEATDIAFKVENMAGKELPAAGGPGTTLVYLVGIAMMVLAATGLVVRRRSAAA